MKKFILWLAKVFNVNITKEVVIEKDVIRYLVSGDVIDGNVEIKGDLIVRGTLKVDGEVVCFKK